MQIRSVEVIPIRLPLRTPWVTAGGTMDDRASLLVHVRTDEGDGWGSAEPYLWTVFFLVDGSTISVNSGLTLSGDATMHFTPGSHGNLPNDDVDAGAPTCLPARSCWRCGNITENRADDLVSDSAILGSHCDDGCAPERALRQDG